MPHPTPHPLRAASPLRIETVPIDAAAARIETARILMREYAALPHVAGRWNTIDQDIAALPAPFVVPQGVLLLAWWEDQPVGCVALGALDASTGEVKRMYVRAAARGRGIGAALLDALLGHARALGHARVRLDTAPELTPAIALYERFGFRPIAPYRESQCLAALYFEREV